MVQGLNWNNYSPAQIIELKKSGVKVPDDIYEKANESVTATTDDNVDVQYEIMDYSSEKNEAKEYTDSLASSGKNKKDILQAIIDKCKTDRTEIEDLIKGAEEQVSYVRIVGSNADTIQNEIEAISVQIEKNEEKVQNEIDAKTAEVEAIQNKRTVTEADQAKVKTLSREINSASDSMQRILTSAKSEISGKASTLKSISSEMIETMNNVGKSLTKAGDGIETGNEAIARGNDAKTLNHRGRNKSGFSKGIFGIKGSREAQKMGNEAISEGATIKTSANTLIDNANKIAEQNNFTIVKAEAATVSAEEAASKAEDSHKSVRGAINEKMFNQYIEKNDIPEDIAERMKELRNQ